VICWYAAFPHQTGTAIDREVAAAMRSANCRRIYFGVESGSEAILRRIRKGIDRAAISRGVQT